MPQKESNFLFLDRGTYFDTLLAIEFFSSVQPENSYADRIKDLLGQVSSAVTLQIKALDNEGLLLKQPGHRRRIMLSVNYKTLGLLFGHLITEKAVETLQKLQNFGLSEDKYSDVSQSLKNLSSRTLRDGFERNPFLRSLIRSYLETLTSTRFAPVGNLGHAINARKTTLREFFGLVAQYNPPYSPEVVEQMLQDPDFHTFFKIMEEAQILRLDVEEAIIRSTATAYMSEAISEHFSGQ